MLVMFDVTNPVERAHTMAKSGGKNTGFDLKELLSADRPIEGSGSVSIIGG
jgi:hypothetical protein